MGMGTEMSNGVKRYGLVLVSFVAFSVSGCVDSGRVSCGGALTGAELSASEQAIAKFNTKTWSRTHAQTFKMYYVLDVAQKCGSLVKLVYYPRPPDGRNLAIVGGGTIYTVNLETGEVIWDTLGD